MFMLLFFLLYLSELKSVSEREVIIEAPNMASRVRVSILFALLASILFVARVIESSEEVKETEFVLTLDHSNFSDTVAKNDFIVVEFYAPWCGHCKSLAPEFEKAASVLSSHDPPIVLAKVDANDEANKGLASEYEIQGFPTLKIIRSGGKNIQEYKGPREADGIVSYLKNQVGPASVEIKSADEAGKLITGKVFIVGLFPAFSGEEYQNFTILAEKLRSDYEFGHTTDAKLLPHGDVVKGPVVRLFKPFDELSIDSKDFHVDDLVKFVEQSSVPTVTVFDKDPNNHPYVVKYFNSPNAKAMLFVSFSDAKFDSFKAKLHEAAELYKGKGISFLVGDLEASQGAFQYFGLKEDQVPLIVIQKDNGQKYLKPNLEPDHIASWLKEYSDGSVKPYKKSEPIPEVNSEPVKVVVADSLQDVVFNSGKNVLLEFYAPWCGHCQKLVPILEEVAIAFQGEDDVVIAKLDATANDFSQDTFEVKGYPTIYFRSASGNILPYDGGRTKEDIIEFIKTNKDKADLQDLPKDDVKDEL